MRSKDYVFTTDERTLFQIRFFCFEDIQSCRANQSVIQCANQRCLIDAAASRNIEKNRMFLHSCKACVIEEVPVLCGQIHVIADHIGLAQQCFCICDNNAEFCGLLLVSMCIDRKHAHPESPRSPGNCAADFTESEQSKRTAI